MSRFERVLLALVFVFYCAATIFGAVHHEPWWDEAQAWLIARDASFPQLFTHVLRYEGHPPLWYLLLAIPAKLGLPYASIKVIALIAGAVSAFLLLFGFPRVPLWVRVLAPFTLFVAYQYTIVARSYVLILPLLLLIARMWDARFEHPGRFALLLILLSNVSVHGFAIACAFAALYVMRSRRAAFVVPFALNALLLLLVLWPPPDNTSYGHHHSPLDPQRHARVLAEITTPLFWPSYDDETPMQAVAMSASALIALTILIAWIFRRGAGAPYALATLGTYAITLRYLAMWHEGIFFCLLLFGTLLAFERRRRGLLDYAAQIVLALLLVRHVEWAARSLHYDATRDYTGSKRTAEFIRENGIDRGVLYGAGTGLLELQPYFPSNVFDNYRGTAGAFWDYSPRNRWPYPQYDEVTGERMARWIEEQVNDRPEYIVYGAGVLEDRIYAPHLFRNRDYVRMVSFSGYSYWKNREMWRFSYHVFRRADMPGPSAPRNAAR